MQSERDKEPHPIDYATPGRRGSRLPSPWLIATVAGNPFLVLGVTIVLTVLVILVRVSIRTWFE